MGLFKTARAGTDPRADARLARSVAAGDPAAVNELIDTCADLLHAYIAHRLQAGPDAVEDIWQDTMVAAFQSISGFKGESRLFTWLCAIANHKILDHLRRTGKDPSVCFSDLPEASLAGMLDQGPLPEEVLLRQSTRIRVVQALGELPADYSRALILRHVEEKSVEETARALGKSFKATESLLHRARAALKATLTSEETQ